MRHRETAASLGAVLQNIFCDLVVTLKLDESQLCMTRQVGEILGYGAAQNSERSSLNDIKPVKDLTILQE